MRLAGAVVLIFSCKPVAISLKQYSAAEQDWCSSNVNGKMLCVCGDILYPLEIVTKIHISKLSAVLRFSP